MSIFAISDLHLGSVVDKPMDRFGPEWHDHSDRIAENWRSCVGAGDSVLVCGDTSWAMRLEEARPDLDYLAALPGRKILLRGNHDYWWSSLRKLRAVLPPDIVPLQNDSVEVEGYCVGGSRGWLHPHSESLPEDVRIYERELGRLRASLESIQGNGPRIAMLHYPPYPIETGSSAVLDLLLEYAIQICVYGHLHAMEPGTYPDGVHRGIGFHCVSVDLVDFAPLRLT
ncbi:MAG: metallophosphoesterase [Candidatus Latescibacterota bacterium]|nr:MAG: metallophosphoesterase [Candidatus Latescibacterota bacterium]